MAKFKSPNYPRAGLGDALAMARRAFAKDNRNKMSQLALAKHLGNDSLSGPALSKISVLRAFGLIEGSGDELRISEDAVTALAAPEGSAELRVALGTLAAKPKLFQEIRGDFPTPPSIENLKFWLIKRKYAPDAAETAANSYLDTLRLVAGGYTEYNSGEKETEQEVPMPEMTASMSGQGGLKADATLLRRAVFNLDEGDVEIKFPAGMSKASVEDLADYLETFMKRLQRETKEAAN